MANKTLNFKLVLLGKLLFPVLSLGVVLLSVLFAGDAAVGKSSCVERFVKNEFFEFQQPTIV